MKKIAPKKGNIAAYLTMIVALIVIMILLRNCSSPAASITDSRAGGDTLNVAIEISPIGVSTRGDTLGGFYYDMIRRVAADNNRAVKIDGFTDIAGALERLQNGRYDLVIADVPMTAELKKDFLFTDPVVIDRQVLVQLVDSVSGKPAITLQQDIAGDTVYLPANSPLRSRLLNLARELGDTIYVVEDPDYASEQLVMMTAIGEIPNAIVNRRMAESMKKTYPRLDTSVEISFNQFQSWILAQRDSVLLDSMNSWLDRFKASPEFDDLDKRYFN